MKLEGRVALVTGGSRGIGRAIAQALAREGAAVGVNYRSGKEQAEEVVSEIEQAGGKARAIPGDVSDYEQANQMVEQTVSELGGLHVLVNNAGISKDALIFHMEPDDWLILNISSVMGERGWLGESNYSASKGAVNAFTRCCAMELARFGVRVNAVLPGFVPTELVEGLVSKDGGKGILKQLPMKSFGDVADVANLVVFLASDDAKYMTGSLVTVDGGAAAMLGTGAPL
jgi:3-oxoacyl-[acyl-carrier protein] reductase